MKSRPMPRLRARLEEGYAPMDNSAPDENGPSSRLSNGVSRARRSLRRIAGGHRANLDNARHSVQDAARCSGSHYGSRYDGDETTDIGQPSGAGLPAALGSCRKAPHFPRLAWAASGP